MSDASVTLFIILIICCCSSSIGAGAYFAFYYKNAKYYEDEIDTFIDKVIESGAAIEDCKKLRDFVIDNGEDMSEKEVKFPTKGTKKGDILDTIMDWDTLKSADTNMGRTKQEKLATLCDSETGKDLVSELVTKVENKDTSFCGYTITDKSIPEFVWDETSENFIEIGKHLENEIENNNLNSTVDEMNCDQYIGPSPGPSP
jgi:hypothetical protein